MVSFTGTCLVHRAEILQLHGDWREALEEARRARERCEAAHNAPVAALALYRQGELHRLRGDFDAAEAAYRDASRGGCEPQPGFALLRLAQGNVETAVGAVRRLLAETADPVRRAGLLPAAVEILLAAGDLTAARAARDELAELAERGGMLGALADQSRGAVELAAGDPHAALGSLRRAAQAWLELDAPYEAARTRELASEACRAVGDADTAALELDAARETFARLGAAPDVARLGPDDTHGLTARELQVLRLVAIGRSNREIASALVISEHTVARHVQNLFAKLGVSSRTEAGAFAFTHGLVRGQN
jgi:ATP/maltotriose-dependent transcriptional regulator MalT